jgi:hypothetical protein
VGDAAQGHGSADYAGGAAGVERESGEKMRRAFRANIIFNLFD